MGLEAISVTGEVCSVDLEYLEPRRLPEAISLLEQHGCDALAIAGGTDVLPGLRSGELASRYLVDLSKLQELAGLELTPGDNLRLGASSTFACLLRSPGIRRSFPMLSEMAGCMGTPQVRNVATVGGNLCNCSPCADSAPVLLCLNATAHIQGPAGRRDLPLAEFFLGPGRTALERGEILVELELPPLPAGAVGSYVKVGRNRGVDLAVVSLAIVGYRTDDHPSGYGFRIGLGAVAPTPIRAHESEAILAERVDEAAVAAATQAAVNAIQPIGDVRASAAYRTMVARNLTGRAIQQVLRHVA
jgi:carbon-monoxide dehydrogenase medium subunit